MQYTSVITNSTDSPSTESSSIAIKILVGIILCLIIFLSITGNILVCIAICTDRRLRKLGNLFLVSLAVADLFVAALVMTFAVANDLMEYWVFGQQFCDTWTAFDVMCSTASILNLCAISLDRYIHIKDPLRYTRWMTKKIVLLSIVAIWLLSVLVSFLPISLGWHKPKNHIQKTIEEKPVCALELTALYAVVSSVISFYVPCIVMVALYSRLYYYARKHVESIRAVTKITPCDQINNPIRSLSHSSHITTDHKAAITLGIIMGSFLVCWMPFFCINIVAGFCKTCISDDVFKTLTWLGYCNSALNPVIYSIFNTEFRDAFRKVLVTYFHTDCCSVSRCHSYHKSRKSRTCDGKLYMAPSGFNQRTDDPLKETNGDSTQI
ncbi:dopamine receptor 1-like [Centruroides sculpturatus]|uniref:dopamine receptor 1-like n=1 Tax=Centruroides sculpturatus TaxID=218467 RepID=UPI000C6E8738|nr:dopamine receptor 1-like [Centruroides sculpturatus]XP_023227692.1 dopamine receptor 1-like [Centruroides sculpturatus]XP_023227693.1 dopamine receptor 1-like [Centruroides sculpturatus]XP_023227694.1 dopamine receptor 1-like [Centruroides sculpturatus]